MYLWSAIIFRGIILVINVSNFFIQQKSLYHVEFLNFIVCHTISHDKIVLLNRYEYRSQIRF